MNALNLPNHVLNSLGYKNLMTALEKVFGDEINIVDYHQDMDENTDRYDDFKVLISYKNQLVLLWISETRTVGMMHNGHGGWFSIKIPQETKFNLKNWYRSRDLSYFLSSNEADYLKHEGSRGRDKQAIEKSLQILKKYLTHDSTYLQAKETIEKALQKVSQINQIVENEWKGQNFKDYLKVYENLEESIISFNKLLEKGDTLLQKYEKESDLKNN